MYYGQFETDKKIEQYFLGKINGNCVEVGAAQGIAASNTKYFEDIGWYCLCIEPIPELYNQLTKNRKNALNFAVSDYTEKNKIFAKVLLDNNDCTAISSLNIDQRLFQAHQVKSVHEIRVNVDTLDNLLEKYFTTNEQIDFVSIDTEGTELDVLKGFSLNKWNPYLLVIESNYDEKKITKYPKKFNYVLVDTAGVNYFYVPNEKS
jgi:FkbM family methyltransferase